MKINKKRFYSIAVVILFLIGVNLFLISLNSESKAQAVRDAELKSDEFATSGKIDDYVKPVDTVKPVEDKKPVVEVKKPVERRIYYGAVQMTHNKENIVPESYRCIEDGKGCKSIRKFMTSEGEIYGRPFVSVKGRWRIKVGADGDGWSDYFLGNDGESRDTLEKKGLSDVCEKYCGEYGISMIIEKFNTNGKSLRMDGLEKLKQANGNCSNSFRYNAYCMDKNGAGYDKVKVFIDGERDEKGEYVLGTGVLVYDGEIRNREAINYISFCLHPESKDFYTDKERESCLIKE